MGKYFKKIFYLFIFVYFLSVTNISSGFQINERKFNKLNSNSEWEILNSGISDRYLNSIFMISNDTGWVAGQDGIILKTTDSGITWNSQMSATNEWIYSIFFIDDQKGWATGQNGMIIKTTNGGATWTEISKFTSSWFFSVFFIDDDNGWVSGQNGLVYNTSDGGNSWNLQYSGAYWLLSLIHI